MMIIIIIGVTITMFIMAVIGMPIMSIFMPMIVTEAIRSEAYYRERCPANTFLPDENP